MSIDNSYSSLITILKSKFKTFLIVGVVAVIVSAVASSSIFIPPKFKSDAVLYPSNLGSYSTESATEQLLQLLHGNDIRDSIINKYDLINYYEIDTASDGYLHKLYGQFNDNVTIKKTNFESVIIEVLDTDPVLAQKIASELIDQVNIKIRLLHQSKSQEVVIIYQNEMALKKELIDTLEAEIKKISTKYGLLDYTEQSREVTAGYMNMLLESKQGKSMEKAEELYNNLKLEGRHFQDLHHQLTLAREDYNKLLILFETAKRDVNKSLTYTNTVVYPEVADKKSYPIRWIIVALSLIASLVLTFVLILFSHSLKQ